MRFGSRKATAAGSIRPVLYGDVPLESWPAGGSEPEHEPWISFDEARSLVHRGDIEGAKEIWERIAATSDLESRQVLQAWHFLRQYGVSPDEGVAATVLGAVAEVPMGSSHDVLVAYADGSVRYLNHSGKVALLEPPVPAPLSEAATVWLDFAQGLSQAIGPWEGPLPTVPRGHARVLMLTPSGPRFGQGPFDDLQRDPAAGAFLAAAATVLQLVVGSVLG